MTRNELESLFFKKAAVGEWDLPPIEKSCSSCGRQFNAPYESSRREAYSMSVCSLQCEQHIDELILLAEQEKMFLAAGVPRHFVNRSFDDFDPDTPARRQAIESCRLWASDHITGLLLKSGPGRGKTLLAACAAMLLLAENKPLKFVYVPDLVMTVQRGFKLPDADPYGPMFSLREYDYIVLDEFGAVKMTEFAGQIIHQIIDNIERDKRHVLITTNLKLSEMEAQFGDKVMAQRIISRITGLCRCLTLDGPDYRQLGVRTGL